jgi:DNA repair protein RecO (recombination protein O)
MGLEWAEPGIILRADPFGEGDALAAVFTEAQGVFRGLARGGYSKARANIWQVGNLVEARWVARLADQLGSFTAELVHPAAALAMQEPLTLATLLAACAVAEGALPEREAHARIFRGLLHLIVHVTDEEALAELVLWESGLLTELGYGLDLSACAVTGSSDHLAFVSPRTGRAVCEEAAGLWRERLFRLPPFLTGGQPATMQDIADGFRITGHFLARDVFGLRNLNLPSARIMLYERVRAEAER